MDICQYATFRIGSSLFGIDVLQVREIIQHADITVVDRAPAFVAGLLNLRGQLVTVLDPGVKLGIRQHRAASSLPCIVLNTLHDAGTGGAERQDEARGFEHDICGILADSIGDLVSVEKERIQPPPANTGAINARYLDGVAPLTDELLCILKVNETARVD